MTELKVVKVRSLFAPRWYQLRYRYKWWRLTKRAKKRTPLQQALDLELDRQVLFGDKEMRQCPECDFETDNLWAEAAHMQEKHPEVIEERLTVAGFIRNEKGEWIDRLADPNN